MANDDVLGPRKTMFVLVIVVGCFAVLWPRILSPLIVGHSREQLKPNQFDREAAVKQERPPIRMGPHPAMRERGRAIPPGAPAPSKPIALPPHLRPPPIPGMRPPLGSPGGPVPAPKSSMGFVMPIYTICIIVFFVYTLSKILFKRTGSPYEPVAPDPQFRRRVFRDDSRSSPDKLGHKDADTIVSAISGLVAEVQQQMETSYAQNQQRQDALDSTRPYSNGSIVLNSGPVQIVTSEYQESKEKTPEPQKTKESSPKLYESDLVTSESAEREVKVTDQIDFIESTNITEVSESGHVDKVENLIDEKLNENAEIEHITDEALDTEIKVTDSIEGKENLVDELLLKSNEIDAVVSLGKISEDLINEERMKSDKEEEHKESTPELLEEALKEDSPVSGYTPEHREEEIENSSVKVIGMEVTADGGVWPRAPTPPAPLRPHEAEEVTSIFLETDIPQQSRVLVSDFAENRAESPKPAKNAPLVVSGKITLSLIQDAPRDTPERDPESTVDDFTTASAFTQPALEKEDDLSDEEIEEVEEIEVEEIEEEVEEEEVEEIEEDEEEIDVKGQK